MWSFLSYVQKFSFLAVVFLCIYCQTFSSSREHDSELIFATTLCRHGDRNPELSYPNDPWKSLKYWPGGYSELTNVGKQQHYELGQYLRERYAKLLGNGEYSSDKVYIFSTDEDRCLMSAQACLAGLFPPQNTQKWNSYLDWQPIPVHTIPKDEDNILDFTKHCDRYEALNTSLAHLIFDDLFEVYGPSITYLDDNSGKNLSSLYDLEKIYDTLYVENLKNFSLPAWTEKLKGSPEYQVLFLSRFPSETITTEMKKIRCGFLLKKILDRFMNKTMGTLSPDRSLWLYFAHETTVASMLRCLDMYYKLHQPAYASCIFFELYERNGNASVKIFYKNTTENYMDFPAMEIPKCGTECPLQKMYETYGDILPKRSFNEECKLD